MKEKKFKLKTLEEGRFNIIDNKNIKGGAQEGGCGQNYQHVCYPKYYTLCNSYTYCGKLPNGDPGYQFCALDNSYNQCSSYEFVCIWRQ